MKTVLITVCLAFLPIAKMENLKDLDSSEHYSCAQKLEEKERELEKAIQKIKRGKERIKQLKVMVMKNKEIAAEQTKLLKKMKEKGIVKTGDKKERKGKGNGYKRNGLRRNKIHKNGRMIKNMKHASKRGNNNKGKGTLISKIKKKEKTQNRNNKGANTARKPKLEARVNKSKRKNIIRSKNNRKLPACNAGCPLSTILITIKKYTKVENTLRKLSRMVRWWSLLNSKSVSSLTTFQEPYDAISDATSGGKTCGPGPISTGAKTAHDQLQNCRSSSFETCKTSEILYTKNTTDCTNPIGCSDLTSCDAGSVCDASEKECKDDSTKCDSTCTKNCTVKSCSACTLTQEIIDHANNYCIPQLNAWSKRYRACYSKLTYSNCKTPCQPNNDENLFQCQRNECDLCGGKCGFEECLVNAKSDSTVELDCQCDCFRSLDFEHTNVKSHDESNYPEFAVNQTRFCAPCNLDCFGIAEFERRVLERKIKCLTASASRDSGNYADCRYHGRSVPRYISSCKKPCNLTTDPATITVLTSATASTTIKSTSTSTTTNSTTTSTTTTSTTTTSTTTTSTTTTSTTTTITSTTTTSTTTSTTPTSISTRVARVGEEHREAARRRSWQKREVEKMEEERKAYWHAYVRGITARRGRFIN